MAADTPPTDAVRYNPLNNRTPTNPFCKARPTAARMTPDGLYVLVDDVIWHPHGVVQACAWSIPGVPGRVVARSQSTFLVEMGDGSYLTADDSPESSGSPVVRFPDLHMAVSHLLWAAGRHNPV